MTWISPPGLTNGRLTSPVTYGADRSGGHVAALERAYSDTNTLWAATSTGRIFISKNADDANPAAVQFIRLDSLAPNDPPRYPTAISVDHTNPNHAWITYSGYNSKTPDTPGHVFEVTFNSTVWKRAPAGLPNVNVADLVYVPEKDALYAATHGQGVWQLKVQ